MPMAEPRRTDIAGGQGVQVGDHGLQVNFLFGGRQPAGPVVAGKVPQAPPAFQPREGLLDQLRAAGSGVCVVRAVTGMRGVGKTQLAAAYARECIDAGWRLVAWVNAEDAPAILNGLAVVAERVGVDKPGTPLEHIGLAVRNLLEADGERCLIVFDNVTDMDAVQPYKPAAGKSLVMITSTESAQVDSHEPLTVGVFTQEESLAFLRERTGQDDPEGALVLAEELGYLPLALAQAAAMISRQRLPYSAYLDRMRSDSLRNILIRSRGDAYHRGVNQTILLSVKAVTEDDQTGLCAILLDTVSFLSAQGISMQVLHLGETAGIYTGGEDTVREALGRLCEASLLTLSGGSSLVLAHRLVMRVRREQAAFCGTVTEIVAKVVALLGVFHVSLVEPWRHRAATREFIRQVTALADHFAFTAADPEPEALLALRGHALSCLNDLGDSPAQAIALGEKVVADSERVLGTAHQVSLSSRNGLAFAYSEAGHLDKAVPLYEGVLAERERTLGGTDPLTLVSRSNLASAYHATMRLDEAAQMFEEVLAAHPATLTSRNNLALVYRDAGRIAEALTMFEEVLAESRRALGETHPNTLKTMNNLALVYRDAGHLSKAVPLFETALAGTEREFGASHPETLKSRINLGRAYLDAGCLPQATRLLEAVAPDSERVLGAAHPYTLRSRVSLALAYRAAGRLDEAIPPLEQALPGMERALGTEHPYTVEAREELTKARREAMQQKEDPASPDPGQTP
jgi:tetratricopeptide (TPR) repeat protein